MYLCQKNDDMITKVKEKKPTTIAELLARIDENKTKKPGRKTLADIYGKLIRGYDGLEYQKAARNDWD